MTTKRQYSDNDKATALAALDANGGNLRRTSKQLGIPLATLQRWRDGQVNEDVTDLRTHKKGDLADKYEQVVNAYIDHLLKPDTISSAKAGEASAVAGTATDKMRLLRGLPTEIVSIIPDVVQALQKLGKDPVAIFNDIIRSANENPD